MRIALASCAKLPDWEVDDRPFHDALRARGVRFDVIAWDDAAFDWSRCDACLIRTTWDYHERRDAFLEWAARVAVQTLLLNPLPTITWNTHKHYLRDLEERGVPMIPTVWRERGEQIDIAAIMREHDWSRGFIKPAVGSTARETLRFACDADGLELAQRHADRLLRNEEIMIQPYLESVETTGEVSAIWIAGEITHTVRKVPVPGDYRVQDDFGATDEPYVFTDDELATALLAIDAARGDLLYARADFLRNPDGGLWMNELELVEPSLFFRHGPAAAERLADALLARIACRAR